MSKKILRRSFLGTAGTAAALAASQNASAAFHPIPLVTRGRLEKPTLLGIGAGGKGTTDLEQCKKVGFDVVALNDVVDAKRIPEANDKRSKKWFQVRDAYPNASFGTDYRQMIAEMGDKIDAVVVSAPDHHHFHASSLAMQAGKHVYCQKPLTHGIWEARMLAKLAATTGVKTQMGNQAHANDHMRRCVELIRAGVIGPVKEMHTWTNRPIWPQGFVSPPDAEPVPAGMDWKQWCGPAPWVDYSPVIAPFNWRGWWNYGTGALGDMACHIMDLGYWSMNPGAPKTVVAEQNGASQYSPPINSKITWEFAPNQYSASDGFNIYWYDGYVGAKFDRKDWKLDRSGRDYNHPDESVMEGMSFERFGSVIVGEHGKLFFNRSKSNWVLKLDSNADGFAWPAQSLPRAANQNNYQEWFDAINGTIDQAQSNFGHAGPFTETILLGVLAQRVAGEKLSWQAESMTIDGRPDLQKYIRREYTDGWETSVE